MFKDEGSSNNICFKDLHSLKASLSIETKEGGNDICSRLLHPEKAEDPINCKEEGFSKNICFKEQLLKE